MPSLASRKLFPRKVNVVSIKQTTHLSKKCQSELEELETRRKDDAAHVCSSVLWHL